MGARSGNMLGSRLKALRKEKKLTQKELAEKINVTNVSVSGYESGNRTPDTETLQKLADFFEVSTDFLLGRDDNSLPNLTKRDEIDVTKDLQKIIDGLEGNKDDYAHFNGQTIEDMDEEDRELLIAALETSMRLAKRIAKKKFTPNKYRDKE